MDEKEVVQPAAVFSPVRVILVGLGGIGSKLAEDLARYMTYASKAPKELILIDGDIYSPGNLERQSAAEADVGQPKAKVWAEMLAREFKVLAVSSMNGYVGTKDTKKDNVIPIDKLPIEGAVTLLGVDNHATRKLFSDHFEKEIQNGVLVSGGNNLLDGSVLMSIRLGGANLTPPIDAFHPEIRDPKDKNPADLSCSELAKLEGGAQVLWANKMAACLMGNTFYAVCEGKIDILPRQSEVYFDVLVNAARPAVRHIPGKEAEEAKVVTPVAKKGKEAKKSTGAKKKATRSAVDAIKILDPSTVFPPVQDVGDLQL